MLWIHYIPDLNPGWEAFCKDSWSLIICLIFVNSGCIVSLIFFAKYLPILKLPNLTNGRGKKKVQRCVSINKPGFSSKWPIISGQLDNHTRRVLILCYWEKNCITKFESKYIWLSWIPSLAPHCLKSCFYKNFICDTCVMQGLGVGPRYSTRDHWIQ